MFEFIFRTESLQETLTVWGGGMSISILYSILLLKFPNLYARAYMGGNEYDLEKGLTEIKQRD